MYVLGVHCVPVSERLLFICISLGYMKSSFGM
jgi:hypothetical protein